MKHRALAPAISLTHFPPGVATGGPLGAAILLGLLTPTALHKAKEHAASGAGRWEVRNQL